MGNNWKSNSQGIQRHQVHSKQRREAAAIDGENSRGRKKNTKSSIPSSLAVAAAIGICSDHHGKEIPSVKFSSVFLCKPAKELRFWSWTKLGVDPSVQPLKCQFPRGIGRSQRLDAIKVPSEHFMNVFNYCIGVFTIPELKILNSSAAPQEWDSDPPLRQHEIRMMNWLQLVNQLDASCALDSRRTYKPSYVGPSRASPHRSNLDVLCSTNLGVPLMFQLEHIPISSKCTAHRTKVVSQI
ncbi:receptor-like protein 12 [Dorcoceras hygrometricum]|uniref:Receptor-like protein 12 n=1 Tax=Dorcoceras hygrometricum TaxID=472368 RepID=A0A2Z7B417_9LAMI|nr:receptor-like protein 12 [Dorcoceras hygrometricum]